MHLHIIVLFYKRPNHHTAIVSVLLERFTIHVLFLSILD